MKKLAIALFALILLTVLAACGSNDTSTPSGEDSESSSSEARGKVTVGGKAFTEQQILSKITSIYLTENGFDVEDH